MDAFFKNPHFQHVAEELFEDIKNKEQMEKEFSLEIADEYSAVKRKIAKAVAELLKADIPHNTQGDLLSIYLKDNEISVPLKQLKQVMGPSEFNLFFPQEIEKKDDIPSIPEGDISGLILLLNSIQKEKEQLVEENRRLSEQKADTVNKLHYENQINDLRIEIVNLQKEKSSIIAERDRLVRGNTKLQEELASVKTSAAETATSDDLRQLTEQLALLKAENKTLFELAYTDMKTGVYNANAFNRDFHSVNVPSTILVMVSICKMRLLNETFGRKNGDNAIAQVANELTLLFSYGHVYRVMGDKFNVLISSGPSYNDVYSAIANLKAKLESSKIEIVFGISSGLTYPTKDELIKAAETMLNEMKSGVKINSQTQWQTEESEPIIETPVTTEISAEELLAQYLDEAE